MADSPDTMEETESSFEVRGPAVVSWESQSSDTPRYVNPDPANKRVVLEVCLDRSACLFRLRVPIRLKSLDNTYLYFHIPPDHISSLEWTIDSDAPGVVRQQLNGSLTRLKFRLCTPGQLVVPAQQSLEPKKPATARAIEALVSLAAVDSLSVYVEHTVLSKPRLELLEAAVKSGASSPPARLLDLRSLYNGKGGKYFPSPVDENGTSTASDDAASTVAVDTPPPYDEIGAGPPMPPIVQADKLGKRTRHSSGSRSGIGSPARPLKRVTHVRDVQDASASVSITEQVLKSGLELSEESGLLAQLLALVKMQQETIERLNDTVAGLESRVAEMQGRLDETGDKVDVLDVSVCELGQGVDTLESQMPDIEDILEEALKRKISDEVQEQSRASPGQDAEVGTVWRSMVVPGSWTGLKRSCGLPGFVQLGRQYWLQSY
ncbi:uncharacterized protein B0T15DRAFT_513051 [Chaetomium strumarium]|uniref:Uncharacterized protein n=1 Tax=Chaetomium strumarium TaxID=1170767 RepID=A0AAJ0GMQ7_9PEZI|nr:hypothetical protein B0T15DRAFT_513051 [Chaetomium strumarium]